MALVLAIMTSGNSLAYAKGRGHQPSHKVKVKVVKKNSISLQKKLKAIAPKTTTSSAIDAQIVTQAGVVKTAYDTYNTQIKQIVSKRYTAWDLIMQIRMNNHALSNDQYTNLNTLISNIDNEAGAIVPINGMNNVLNIVNGKNTIKAGQVTVQDLTTILNNITANTTHLNTISSTYDTINSVLTGVANTTPAAITTQAAIAN